MRAGRRKRLLVLFLFVALLSLAITNLIKLLDSTRPPLVYIKDFNVEYVMARAVLNGESPYKPLPELARYADGYTAEYLKHPSPHPPPVIIVGIPFTYFDLSRAALLWLLFELACLAVSSVLMVKAAAGRVNGVAASMLFLVCVAWDPFDREMFWGQLMILTLTLISGAWVALRSERDVPGGLLLGVALALKLFGWPIVLFLLLTRRWRAVFAAALSFALLNLAAALLIGFNEIVTYYTVIGPEVSKLYRGIAGNFSVWSIGPRLFDASADGWYKPLIDVPALAPLLSIAAVVGVLVLVIRETLHRRPFDSAFCALACISIVINPIAWSHYLVLTAPAMCLLAWRMKQVGFSRRNIIVAGVVLVMGLLIEYVLPVTAALSSSRPVPFLISVITFFPLTFVFLLTHLTLRALPQDF